MEQEKINKIIEFLEQVLEYPAMHFGAIDAVERADSYLAGIRYGTFVLFDLDRYSIIDFHGEATTRRGHKFTPRGAIQDLKNEGYENTQIVIEIIKIEIDFWELVRNSLHKQCAE